MTTQTSPRQSLKLSEVWFSIEPAYQRGELMPSASAAAYRAHLSIHDAVDTVLEINERNGNTDTRAVSLDRLLTESPVSTSYIARSVVRDHWGVLSYTREARLYSVISARRARLRANGPASVAERADRRLLAVRAWRSSAMQRADLASVFRDAYKAVVGYATGDTSRREMRDAAQDLWDHLDGNFNTDRRNEMLETFYDRCYAHRGVSRSDLSELPFTKQDCGHWAHDDDATTTASGRTVCTTCRDEDYVFLNYEYHHRDDCYYWESDEEYHLEPEEDEDEDEDDSCDGMLSSWGASTGSLAHTSPNPSTQWGDFTMGVELEVEAEDSRTVAVSDCYEHFNKWGNHDARRERYAMFKRDGSLNDAKGFEIVTAARTLGDHIDKFKTWTPRGLIAWEAGNCGLHVHIDSRAFTALTLGKFLMLYNDSRNASFIRAIAGRHPDRDAGAKNYAAALSQTVNPASVKLGSGTSRYRMVNVTNLTQTEQTRLHCEVSRDSKGSYSTVEVRIFRASLKKDRLLAQIEFAHASVMFCRVASWHELNGDTFKAWLARTPGYPSLAKWFGVPVCRTNAPKAQPETAEV